MRWEILTDIANMIESAALKEDNIGFNMATFCRLNTKVRYAGAYDDDMTGHGCKTVACIAGWIVFAYNEDGTKRSDPTRGLHTGDASGRAKNILGATSAWLHSPITERGSLITEREALEELFMGWGLDGSLWDVTPQHAVWVIRDFVENKVVRWNP